MSVLRTCPVCHVVFSAAAGAVNRAQALGYDVRCSKACADEARRKHKTQDQKRAEKADYDRLYRGKNRQRIKDAKAARHKETYDPKAAAIVRKRRMPYHVEYCRRDEYRQWKRGYDADYRARRIYGPFAEAYKQLLELDNAVASLASWYDVATQKGTINKKLTRRRDHDRAYSD